jgi:Na+-driven multidrug efflux pump
MRGSGQRPANVIVTVVVSYLVGLPMACCLGALLFGPVRDPDTRSALIVALAVAALVVPGIVAWWWNYRRRPPSGARRPWV